MTTTPTAQAHRGLSLIEVLVYVAILLVVSVGAVSLLLSLSGLLDGYKADRVLRDNAVVALERLLHEVRAADAVDTGNPNSVLTASPGRLVLTAGTTTTEFFTDNGSVVLMVNGVTEGPLTGSAISVDEIRFFHLDNGGTEAVRVVLGLTATVGKATSTAVFHGAAVLRGSYD